MRELALSLGSIGKRDETFWFVPPAGKLVTENPARDLPCPQSLSHGESVVKAWLTTRYSPNTKKKRSGGRNATVIYIEREKDLSSIVLQ